jgi:hypothetical protein
MTKSNKIQIQGKVYPTPASRGKTIKSPVRPTLEEAAKGLRAKMLDSGIGYEPVFIVTVVEDGLPRTINDPDKDKTELDVLRGQRVKLGLDQ